MPLKAERVEHEINETLNQTSRALQRYSSRVEFLGTDNKRYLDLDSEAYLNQLPILKRIGLIDKTNRVYWSYPHDIGNEVQGLDQSKDIDRLAALEQAKNTRKPSLSRVLKLKSGGLGFLMPVALFPKGEFAGYVYATVEAEKLFHSFVPTSDFQISIYERSQLIFISKITGPLVPEISARHEMSLNKSQWIVEVTPTETFLAESHSPLATYILFFGIFISLVIGGLLQKLSLSQREIQSSLEWRKALINSSSYAIISTDADGIIRTFNSAATKMLGYEPDEVVGKVTPKIFHVKEESIARAEVLSRELGRVVEPGFDAFTAKAKTLRIADENEWTFVRKNKIKFPASLSVTAFRNADGDILGYLGVCLDLTEKKKAQEQLTVSGERLKRVVEATGEGTWEREYTRDGKIRFLDSQSKRIFGFAESDEPNYEQIAAHIAPEDRKGLSETLKFHFENKTPGFSMEFRMTDKADTGKRKWVRARGKIVADSAGVPLLISTVQDVTSEIEKREQLTAALIAAEDATRAKSEFLANMSHEIRTPINGVLGMTGLLLDEDLKPREREYAETVRSSAEILLSLVNDILDFSKIEARKLDLEIIDFDLELVTHNIERLLHFSAKKKGIKFLRTVSSNMPTMFFKGDPNRIGQVLANLIGNAVKFTEHGQVSINIFRDSNNVEGKVSDPNKVALRIEVTDTGIGMSKAALTRMFQPFSQAEASMSRRFGGTGLGLSICKHLVEMMGGQIGVQSQEGVGSTFWFTLELEKSEQTLDRGEKSKNIISIDRALPKIRILLAEDNPVNQLIGKKMLEKRGFRVDVAANGNEVIDALNTAPYDLILMDCQMPELDGYSASMKIRSSKDQKYCSIPIIAMTANAMTGDREKCLSAGMDDYVTKPIKAEDLVSAIEKMLAKSSPSQTQAA